MPSADPQIVILAGPNGAGKSTTAPALLKGPLRVGIFVNADVIAHGLSGFDPGEVALLASRIMLERLHELANARASFAFETTLASRTLVPWLKECIQAGYWVHLVYLWLASDKIAIARVADRVRRGGHDVSAETIRRRYQLGLQNLFELYQPLVTTWRVYDNSETALPQMVARGRGTNVTTIRKRVEWEKIVESAQRVR